MTFSPGSAGKIASIALTSPCTRNVFGAYLDKRLGNPPRVAVPLRRD